LAHPRLIESAVSDVQIGSDSGTESTADGQKNREIGAQLFLSPRTVEWHLHKVFAKLGIDSRGELRDALPDAARTGVPA
jgi:hypothetical protein